MCLTEHVRVRVLCCAGIGYMAYALMANGLETFMDVKTPVCLSDPVCDKKHFRTMAAAFIKEHPKAMFVQVCAGDVRDGHSGAVLGSMPRGVGGWVGRRTHGGTWWAA